MKTLKIDKKTTRKLDRTVPEELRTTLMDTSKKGGVLMNVTDRIKTYEDACDELGIDPDCLPDVEKCQNEDEKSIVAYYKLIIITRALNEGWKPNWQDNDERKWYPWFDLDTDAPSRFACYDTYYRLSNTSAGTCSRLCFKSDSLAKYAGKQFIDLYRDLMLIY